MPVSESKETGVRSATPPSSDYGAGVPIKKRRFPFVRPPSPPPKEPSPPPPPKEPSPPPPPKEPSPPPPPPPPPKEPSPPPPPKEPSPPPKEPSLPPHEPSTPPHESSLPEKTDEQPQMGHFASFQGSVPSTSGVAAAPGSEKQGSNMIEANVSDVSVGERDSLKEKNDCMDKGTFELSTAVVQEPMLVFASGSSDDKDRTDKPVKGENLVGHDQMLGRSDLPMALSESCHLMMEGSCTKHKLEVDEKSSDLVASSMMDAGPAWQKSEGTCLDQNKFGNISLDLSLTDEKGSTSTGGGKRSNSDATILCANRSNWDLNTTMDAWEDSASDSVCVSADSVYGGMNATAGNYDMKPSTQPPGKSLEQKFTGSESKGAAHSMSSRAIGDNYISENSLNLGLQPSFLQSNLSQEPLSSASIYAGVNYAQMSVSTCKPNVVNQLIIKSEPIDESVKQFIGVMKTVDNRTVKCESSDEQFPEAHESPICKTLQTVNSRSIKAEPGCEGMGASRTNEDACLRSYEQMSNGSELCSLVKQAGDTNHLLETESCPSESVVDRDTVGTSEHRAEGGHHEGESSQIQGTSENATKIGSDTITTNIGPGSSELPSSMENALEVEKTEIAHREECGFKVTDKIPPSLKENAEGAASDGEKIEISACMMEEDCYDSEYDSDGNLGPSVAVDAEHFHRDDNEYEDGEVREQVLPSTSEGHTGKTEDENVSNCESEHNRIDFGKSSCYNCATLPPEGDGARTQVDDQINENLMTVYSTANVDNNQRSGDEVSHLQESSPIETGAVNSEMTGPVNTTGRKMLDDSVSGSPSKDLGSDPSYSQGIKLCPAVVATTNPVDEEAAKTDSIVSPGNGDEIDTGLPKAEASLNSEIVSNDGKSEGNKRRIINLSRSNVSSPDKARSIPDRSIPLRAGRKRLPDIALEGDKPLRGRDEYRDDGFNKFPRERNQDMFSRNSRSNFARDRANWDSEQELGSKVYNGFSEFPAGRYKYAPDFRNYNGATEDGVGGAGRGGRKLLTDEAPNFRHLSSRRRSPGGRDGPAARGQPMVGGIPRNISPARCIDVSDSEIVRLRHGNKFMRDFQDDNMEQMFDCQPSYGEADGFIRGDRNITSFKGKVFRHHVRSKSPLRLRSGSPVEWPPRRRSPEVFGGHPPLTHRRSPTLYRRHRMRSPERTCFHGEMMIRRQNSPPYATQPLDELREMNSGRDHGFARPIMSNRSPSGRIPMRNRRYDIINPRERPHGEYFRMPMRSSRFHELGGDGDTDERRRMGEKRGPVRHFRPYGANGESFMYNADEESRPYRLCSEDDPAYPKRGSSREMQLDRRNKNRAGDVHKARTVDEQEGNYRHGGLSDEFDDASRNKRKRF